MNVRNFWMDVKSEGRNPIGIGPRSKDGQFTATLYMRHKGESVKALEINGIPRRDGYIGLSIELNETFFTSETKVGDKVVIDLETKR